MKKSTLIVWAIIVGLLALVIFQNKGFFLQEQTLRINFGVVKPPPTPLLPVAVFFLIFFFAGFVIAYLFNLPARYKANRAVKKLNATITSCNKELSDLKREIDTLKGIETPAEIPATTTQIEAEETSKVNAERLVERPAEKTGQFSVDEKEANPAENSEETSSLKNP